MGANHSCTMFRGGFVGQNCNPATGHAPPPDPKPKAPPVKPFVAPTSSLGLQGAETNQFNTAYMGGSRGVPAHF